MIPDLGKYAGPVLWSYAVSLVLIAVMIAWSIHRARRVKAALEQVENKSKTDA